MKNEVAINLLNNKVDLKVIAESFGLGLLTVIGLGRPLEQQGNLGQKAHLEGLAGPPKTF